MARRLGFEQPHLKVEPTTRMFRTVVLDTPSVYVTLTLQYGSCSWFFTGLLLSPEYDLGMHPAEGFAASNTARYLNTPPQAS